MKTTATTALLVSPSSAGPDRDAASGVPVTRDGAAAPPSAGASGAPATARRRDADGMAVASFVLGLVGLVAFNLLLGPLAVGLAVLALRRRTRRTGRALLGLALGVADLAVLAVLVTANDTVSWSIG
ncbi:hypothetical protein BJP40_27310 [Streptomyces sp. CC53]|uniref:hypothetical protein n=1 Tax=unclassified Streptomyces TaxID=2593676 RepID=UPI0008DEA213|nr:MULTISPECIES: hypothetical protein [unclassified Streptomyces]OII62776.1 hypothetical protein BJP40_27310 [Streptomyces sp. CC53]OII70601.1 hypothetical protein BJP39_02650 [Streptomyces sp. CC77]